MRPLLRSMPHHLRLMAASSCNSNVPEGRCVGSLLGPPRRSRSNRRRSGRHASGVRLVPAPAKPRLAPCCTSGIQTAAPPLQPDEFCSAINTTFAHIPPPSLLSSHIHIQIFLFPHPHLSFHQHHPNVDLTVASDQSTIKSSSSRSVLAVL